jgi:anthranilate/para-aminobenzoate synthase component II
MKKNSKRRKADTKTKESLGPCTVGGWGMDRHGNITVVEPHEVPMMSHLSDDERMTYYKSILDNPQMPEQVKVSTRNKIARLDATMAARKRRKVS